MSSTAITEPSLVLFAERAERSGRAAARVNRAASSATSQATSVRTCAGCGRKAPKAELLRFVAVDGALTPAQHAPGRGVYTCRRLGCFERAQAGRGFSRTLKAKVRVDPGLTRLYTDANV
jgi:predicted RNA-binding protein YlxR (DUF448 family)